MLEILPSDDTSYRTVKAGATVWSDDFARLRMLANTAGGRFHCGILLYTGEGLIPFGSETYAVPVPFLWQIGVRSRG